MPICEPISGLYCDVTPIQVLHKQPHSRSFELNSRSKCRPELKPSWFRSTNGKLKLRIDVDDLLDGLSISAFSLEIRAEDCAMDMPKIAGRFLDNLFDDILDHHGKHSCSQGSMKLVI